MLNLSDAEMAWAIYLLSAFVLWLSVWRLTSRFWVWIKDPLRAVSAVLLFMPASALPVPDQPAPALFLIAYELLGNNSGEVGARVAVNLMLVCLIVVIASWVLRGIWLLIRRNRTQAAPPPPTPGFGGN